MVVGVQGGQDGLAGDWLALPHVADTAVCGGFCQESAKTNVARQHSGNKISPVRLDLFSSNRLYAALEKAAYPDLPPPRTFRDWVRNSSGPPSLQIAIRELLDQPDTTKKADPPEWASRLEAKVDQLVIGAIADPEQRETVRRLAARLGVLPKPSAAGFDDLRDTEDRDAAAPGGQGSS